MTGIFGRDIAGDLAKRMGPKLLKATLIREEIEPNNEILGTPTVRTIDYPCRGFTASIKRTTVQNEQVIAEDRKISILGGSLPSGISPRPKDIIRIEDREYRVLGILGRDAAAALYTLHGRP